jgi:hypothetical protein
MRKILKKQTLLSKKKTIKKRKTITKRKTLKKRKSLTRRCKKGGEKDICAVCLEDFTNPNDDITLSCGHTFHKGCMVSTCESSLEKTGKCGCPLCRKELTTGEMNGLGFLSTPTFDSTFDPSLGIMDNNLSLDTMEKFTVYVNNKLRVPTTSPIVLRNVLDIFIGTDNFPSDLIGKIMVFDLQRISSNLNGYRFIGLVEDTPRDRGNKKYFEFKFNDEDEYENIPMEVVQV